MPAAKENTDNSNNTKIANEKLKIVLFDMERETGVSVAKIRDQLILQLESEKIQWVFVTVAGEGDGKVEFLYHMKSQVTVKDSSYCINIFL